jgi:hypothetical protein
MVLIPMSINAETQRSPGSSFSSIRLCFPCLVCRQHADPYWFNPAERSAVSV